VTINWYVPLSEYARRFHAGCGPTHHVASPLGAWLLLALGGPASAGSIREEIAAALGMDIDEAARAAAALLAEPHPLVSAAAAVWHRPAGDRLDEWLRGLPAAVQTGDIPSQARLDAWSDEHTGGLIPTFPVRLRPDALVLLASALATKISWDRPFDLTGAADLGADSPWAAQVNHVLRTPAGHGHTQFIAATERAGDVAVHTADVRWQEDAGLSVTSVIAAADVPMEDVLSEAQRLGVAAVTEAPVDRRSLFDLPSGPSPLWTITEEEAPVQGGREEVFRAVLPAWSARSEHDIDRPELGLPASARALAALLGRDRLEHQAKQAVAARFSRVGFEAAAVSAQMVHLSMTLRREGLRRTAQLRFKHPYAVVAVTTQRPDGPWHGVPVFSAWVARAEEAS
jgi:hypothetical protein